MTNAEKSSIISLLSLLVYYDGRNPEGGVFTWQKYPKSMKQWLYSALAAGEDNVKGLVEKFKTLIENNGTVEEVNEWGKRKLAYEIDDQTEGYYVLYTFESKPDFPAEFERVLKITDGVMRSMITVK